MNEVIKTVVDRETGEMIDVRSGDYFKHIPAGSVEAMHSKAMRKAKFKENMENKGMATFDEGRFLKIFTDEFFLVMREMQPNEVSLIVQLAEYMEVGSNVLIKKNNKSKVRMKDILRMSKTTQSATYKSMRGLFDKMLIVECTDANGESQYVINPYIMIKGGWMNKTLVRLFDGYKKRTLQYKNETDDML